MTKFDKKENCEYCNARMESKYRNKRFCSVKCRVYWNREDEKNGNIKVELPKQQEIKKTEPAKELTRAELWKLMKDGKI